MNNKTVHMVAFALLVVGGLNWLLVAFNFNLVEWLFVDLIGVEMLAMVTYVIVGLAALYEVVIHKSTCVHCGAGGSEKPSSPDADMPTRPGTPGGGI